jgi:hypothetical protein
MAQQEKKRLYKIRLLEVKRAVPRQMARKTETDQQAMLSQQAAMVQRATMTCALEMVMTTLTTIFDKRSTIEV